MHRRKIVLLASNQTALDSLGSWVDRHLQYQPYLLVKLEVPNNQSATEKVEADAAPNRLRFPNTISSQISRQRSYKADLTDITRECRFADLVVVQRTLLAAGCYSDLTNDLWAYSHCPLLVANPPLGTIEQLLLIYDGSRQSFTVLQQFSQDFYHFSTTLPATLLMVKSEHLPSPEEKLLIEYLKLHFYNLAVHKIDNDHQTILADAVEAHRGTILVGNRRQPLPDFVEKGLPTESIFHLLFPA